jgi:hypothetical protein
MKLNLNTILLVLAGLGVFAPDVASVAAWLASMNIAWLGTVVKGLGLLAAFCSAAPLVVPRLRSFLALLGLATPPGAQAPWNPGRDGNPPAVTPLVSVPGPVTPPTGNKGTGYGNTVGALIFLGASLLSSAALAQTQPTSPQLGGCLASGSVCFGTAADVVLTKIGLSGDNKGISGGFSTGVGYGATFAPDKFYATGLDLFLNVNLSGASGIASRVSPALMLHAMNYLFLGVGLDVIAPTDAVSSYGTGWSLLLGFGSTITSITPGYAKAEARRQVMAERMGAEAGK